MSLERSISPYYDGLAGDGPDSRVLVAQNAWQLSGAIDNSQTSWALKKGAPANAQVIWIGEEKLTVGNPPATTIARDGVDGTTPAAHPDKTLILPIEVSDGEDNLRGATILDLDFTTGGGLRGITGIICTGQRMAEYYVYANGVLINIEPSVIYEQSVVFAFSEVTPANGERLKVTVCNYGDEALFGAWLVG